MAASTEEHLEDVSNTPDDKKELALKETNATALEAEKSTIKKDWYQTDNNVVIILFVKNLQKEDVNINIESQQVTCKFLSLNENCSQRLVKINLLHQICPEQSSYKVLPTKAEIKLKKQESFWWEFLEGKASDSAPKQLMASAAPESKQTSDSAVPTYPSSCSQKRDWDRIAHDIQEDEASEKLEGESALNQLFQKIYAEGTDEVKKAMNKSFMESGGTVLSTNWKDVGNKHIQVNPPDGLEYKKWDT